MSDRGFRGFRYYFLPVGDFCVQRSEDAHLSRVRALPNGENPKKKTPEGGPRYIWAYPVGRVVNFWGLNRCFQVKSKKLIPMLS